jgi:hypothetical protein
MDMLTIAVVHSTIVRKVDAFLNLKIKGYHERLYDVETKFARQVGILPGGQTTQGV